MYTYDEEIFSDLYKDAHGFRPRGHKFYADDTTADEKQAIWNGLLEDLDVESKRYEERRLEAIVDFENLIKKTIALGAADRTVAIEWLRNADDDMWMKNDDEYFEYSHDLPYGYLKSIPA